MAGLVKKVSGGIYTSLKILAVNVSEWSANSDNNEAKILLHLQAQDESDEEKGYLMQVLDYFNFLPRRTQQCSLMYHYRIVEAESEHRQRSLTTMS